MTPQEMHSALFKAWPILPPTMPTLWANPNQLEHYDAYIALNGRPWNEIDCNAVEHVLSPTLLILGAAIQVYYTAAIIRCRYEYDSDVGWLLMFLEAIADRASSLYTDRQNDVILQFLIDEREHLYGSEADLVEKWEAIVSQRSSETG
jgi:hypothetical protein